jgi:hypothetical protein
MSVQENEISWRVASHRPHDRSNDWYWGLGAIAIVGAIGAIVLSNALLAIIIVLGAFCLGYLSMQPPREHAVVVGPRGIAVDGTRYPWRSIRSFWVEHGDSNASPRLFVSMSGILMPHLSLYLADTLEADEVRRYLKRYAPEVEQGPQLGEQLAEIMGLN